MICQRHYLQIASYILFPVMEMLLVWTSPIFSSTVLKARWWGNFHQRNIITWVYVQICFRIVMNQRYILSSEKFQVY